MLAPLNLEAKKRKKANNTQNEDYTDVLGQPTVGEAIQVVKLKRPRDYCLHGEAIERNLKRHRSKASSALYDITLFNRGPIPLDKSVLLYGPSNTGKTQFALAHFNNPLFCTHIDKLKELSPDHDGIVFDDMSFKHWPPEAIIHLLDKECDRQINVRYGTVDIPANTIKIFTHNTSNPFYNDEINEEQKEAIKRRYLGVQVLNPLFNKP